MLPRGQAEDHCPPGRADLPVPGDTLPGRQDARRLKIPTASLENIFPAPGKAVFQAGLTRGRIATSNDNQCIGVGNGSAWPWCRRANLWLSTACIETFARRFYIGKG